MLKALQKHLPSFLKDAQPSSHAQFQNQAQLPHSSGFPTPVYAHPLNLNMGQLSATQSLKEEASPGKSPTTVASWHSPNTISGQSPIGNGPIGFIQQQPMPQSMRDHHYGAMTPSQSHPQGSYPAGSNTPLGPPSGPPHKRIMSDMNGGTEDHPDNRRRGYPPHQTAYHH